MVLKDEQLSSLSRSHNVAQFASFGPGADPQLRYVGVRTLGPEAVEASDLFQNWDEAARRVLEEGASRSVNIRTFDVDGSPGLPFSSGVTDFSEVIREVRQRTDHGHFAIVNETLDVSDGGVSGVAAGQVIEFAPDDTPRVVEKPGVASLPRELGIEMLNAVYGVRLQLPADPHTRTEFTIHRDAVGIRSQRQTVWESRHEDRVGSVSARIDWPNSFSRLIGDKAYGLLFASLLGLPVPDTTVISRRVAPFTFGRATGSDETWMRTCPSVPTAGKFSTTRGWSDPFAIMQAEDPDGKAISSIVSQRQVEAKWSGAAIPLDHGYLVEGVPGFGDAFMLGAPPTSKLPPVVVSQAEQLLRLIEGGTDRRARMEWAYDGRVLWVLQVHLARSLVSSGFGTGTADHWVAFSPRKGPEMLREVIQGLDPGVGIEFTEPVGVTSHMGEIIRKHRVPAKTRSI